MSKTLKKTFALILALVAVLSAAFTSMAETFDIAEAGAVPVSEIKEVAEVKENTGNNEKEANLTVSVPLLGSSGSGTQSDPWQIGADGSNVTAYFSDGVLIISGTGNMEDFSPFSPWSSWSGFSGTVTSAIIGSGVTSIGENAFEECSDLESVEIPDSITSIKGYAFNGCTDLKNVEIPAGVTEIGSYAFGSGTCKGGSFKINAATPPSASFLYNSTADAPSIYVPYTSVDDYKSAGGWSNYKDSIKGYLNIQYKDQGGDDFSGVHESGYPEMHIYGTDTALKSASKDGYVFDGWYKDADCSGDVITVLAAEDLTSDITLYAKWTAEYTITVKIENEEYGTADPLSVKVKYGTTCDIKNYELVFSDGQTIKPVPYEGYTLEHIRNLENFECINSDSEAEIGFREKEFKVTFDSMGGSSVKNQMVFFKHMAAEPSPAPVKEGYTFDGWYKDEALSTQWNFASDPVMGATTLYAKWTEPEYTITVKIENEEYGTADPLSVKVKYGTTCDIVNYELVFSDGQTVRPVPYEGYTLEHIRNVENFECINSDSEAEIGFREKEFKVTFDSMGGSSVKNQMVFFKHMAAEPSPAPVKEGYTFGGWYKDEALSTQWNFASDPVMGATTLYAKWNKKSDPKPIPTPTRVDNDDYEPLFTGTWGNPVKNGSWSQDSHGIWHYSTSQFFSNTWAYILNPYAQQGQHTSDWFWFDNRGNMLTGWQFIGGKWYYLNPTKDGTLGACQLGGVTPDGWTVDESGAWIESIPKK